MSGGGHEGAAVPSPMDDDGGDGTIGRVGDRSARR